MKKCYHMTSTHALCFSLVSYFLKIVTCFLRLFKKVLNDVITSSSAVERTDNGLRTQSLRMDTPISGVLTY